MPTRRDRDSTVRGSSRWPTQDPNSNGCQFFVTVATAPIGCPASTRSSERSPTATTWSRRSLGPHEGPGPAGHGRRPGARRHLRLTRRPPGRRSARRSRSDRSHRDRLPMGREVRSSLLREPHRSGPVGVHDPDVEVALADLERRRTRSACRRATRPGRTPAASVEALRFTLGPRRDVDREQVRRAVLAAALEHEPGAVRETRTGWHRSASWS